MNKKRELKSIFELIYPGDFQKLMNEMADEMDREQYFKITDIERTNAINLLVSVYNFVRDLKTPLRNIYTMFNHLYVIYCSGEMAYLNLNSYDYGRYSHCSSYGPRNASTVGIEYAVGLLFYYYICNEIDCEGQSIYKREIERIAKTVLGEDNDCIVRMMIEKESCNEGKLDINFEVEEYLVDEKELDSNLDEWAARYYRESAERFIDEYDDEYDDECDYENDEECSIKTPLYYPQKKGWPSGKRFERIPFLDKNKVYILSHYTVEGEVVLNIYEDDTYKNILVEIEKGENKDIIKKHGVAQYLVYNKDKQKWDMPGLIECIARIGYRDPIAYVLPKQQTELSPVATLYRCDTNCCDKIDGYFDGLLVNNGLDTYYRIPVLNAHKDYYLVHGPNNGLDIYDETGFKRLEEHLCKLALEDEKVRKYNRVVLSHVEAIQTDGTWCRIPDIYLSFIENEKLTDELYYTCNPDPRFGSNSIKPEICVRMKKAEWDFDETMYDGKVEILKTVVHKKNGLF